MDVQPQDDDVVIGENFQDQFELLGEPDREKWNLTIVGEMSK